MVRGSNNRLRIERRRRGWTQQDLVNVILRTVRLRGMSEPKGLSANYVSRWKRDDHAPPQWHRDPRIRPIMEPFDMVADK
jgi:transcriptional regulator with XRE-family HTH domain